ncbi:hypothetical protein DOK76_03790 [Vagococcus sp. DIV0080]|uniref:Uncharacterized protein n=1 Tax=Candidatus Vagococcus giribetii TaxID=2230876 RepID=A0ABS3HSI7_9ENTE|nr:hypothetical protein [Vagococcus sp. DIV0080]MBO0476177.1 hypothetical protein [Vagococcus sp. DIV0080]
MRLLKFKDTHNNNVTIPLLKSFFKSVSYPLSDELYSAQLITNDNKTIHVLGTNFELSTYGGAAIE